MRPFYEQRVLALLRIQFMEARFTIPQKIKWMDAYLDTLKVADEHGRSYQQAVLTALSELGKTGVYHQLVLESAMMDQNTLRMWLEMMVRHPRFSREEFEEYMDAYVQAVSAGPVRPVEEPTQ